MADEEQVDNEQAGMDEVLASPPVVEAAPTVASGTESAQVVDDDLAPPATPSFIGDYTEAQVLDALATVEKLKALASFDPTALEQKLVRSLSGHLGPLAARLKAVESLRDVEIDPAAFAGLKELDGGVGEWFEQNLPKALKIQRHDPQELLRPLLEQQLGAFGSAQAAALHDYKQEVLAEALMPDMAELENHPLAEKFVEKLPAEDLAALDAWYPGENKRPGQKNARAVISIFSRLKAEIAAANAASAADAKALKAVVRPPARGSAVRAPSSLSPDEIEQRAMDEVLNPTRRSAA